jgi:hypothetical protein
VDITVGDDLLGLCDKKIPINMGPAPNDYVAISVSRKRTPVNQLVHFMESIVM